MANMFNEDGTYNKTEWKAGDKITAVKLNKIESSLETINNNDIDRHVEADSRLDALTEELETVRLELDAVLKILQDHAKFTNPLMERVRPEMVIRFDRDLLSSFYIYKGVLK